MLTAMLQLQSDLAGKLSVELAPWGITVVSLRKMILQNTLDAALLTITDRDGKHGCGCAVEIPTFGVSETNLPGPQGDIRLSVLVIENPTENLGANGTQRSAEEVARQVTSLLHMFRMQNVGTIFARGNNVIEPADDIPGHIGYRVNLQIMAGQEVLAKTGLPVITGIPEAVTITNASGSSGAAIYYSTDGESYPGPFLENCWLYTAPFAVPLGTTIRAVAYLAGATGSDVIESTMTSA